MSVRFVTHTHDYSQVLEDTKTGRVLEIHENDGYMEPFMLKWINDRLDEDNG